MQLTLSDFNEHKNAQKLILWISYGFYVLFLTAPIGFVISLLKSREYKPLLSKPEGEERELLEILASHHQWLSTTFLVTFVFAMISAGTFYYGFGIVLAVGTAIWWIYRIGRGIIGLVEHKSMPVWTGTASEEKVPSQ